MAGPVVMLLGIVCLVAMSWTGWGFETDPAAQLGRDAPWVAVAGVAGGLAGALLVWAGFGMRPRAVVVGGVLGVLPAAVLVTAYFTNLY